MTKEEARAALQKDFMSRYTQWLEDYNNTGMDEKEYGHKYGWSRSPVIPVMKDSIKAVVSFQKYMEHPRTADQISRDTGVNRENVWALRRDGWLSAEDSNRNRATYYWVNQKTAKEIWKAAKEVSA